MYICIDQQHVAMEENIHGWFFPWLFFIINLFVLGGIKRNFGKCFMFLFDPPGPPPRVSKRSLTGGQRGGRFRCPGQGQWQWRGTRRRPFRIVARTLTLIQSILPLEYVGCMLQRYGCKYFREHFVLQMLRIVAIPLKWKLFWTRT